jgi:hypothetical protein
MLIGSLVLALLNRMSDTMQHVVDENTSLKSNQVLLEVSIHEYSLCILHFCFVD